jgi:hypothetical protein
VNLFWCKNVGLLAIFFFFTPLQTLYSLVQKLNFTPILMKIKLVFFLFCYIPQCSHTGSYYLHFCGLEARFKGHSRRGCGFCFYTFFNGFGWKTGHLGVELAGSGQICRFQRIKCEFSVFFFLAGGDALQMVVSGKSSFICYLYWPNLRCLNGQRAEL